MYADDTTLYFNQEDFNSVTTNDDINSCLDKINIWLKETLRVKSIKLFG